MYMLPLHNAISPPMRFGAFAAIVTGLILRDGSDRIGDSVDNIGKSLGNVGVSIEKSADRIGRSFETSALSIGAGMASLGFFQ